MSLLFYINNFESFYYVISASLLTVDGISLVFVLLTPFTKIIPLLHLLENVLSATIWNVRPKRSWAMTLKGPNGCWAACGPFIRAGVAGFLF